MFFMSVGPLQFMAGSLSTAGEVVMKSVKRV